MGDDPQRRHRAAHSPDRFGAADRGAEAAAAPAHVDYRDVEVAEVTNQVEGLLAAARLVHLEAVLEHASEPESDQGVTIDHKAVWAFAQGGLPVRR